MLVLRRRRVRPAVVLDQEVKMAKTALLPDVLNNLGLLHDCKIMAIKVEPDRLHLDLEDLYANTVGLPDYPGALPVTIEIKYAAIEPPVLVALKGIHLPAKIYELEMTAQRSGTTNMPYWFCLRLSPSGHFEFPVVGGDIWTDMPT